MSSLGGHDKMARTKTNTQNDTKARRQAFRKKLFFMFYAFFLFFYFYLLFHKSILQEMLSYRLGTVNAFHLEFEPVFSNSKPHTFSTFFGTKKICFYSSKLYYLDI